MLPDLPITQPRSSSSNLPSPHFASNLNLPESPNHSTASFKPTPSASSPSSCGSKTCRKLEAQNGKDNRARAIAIGSSYISVFDRVPSLSEVLTAVSFLQNIGRDIHPSGSELKWLQNMVESRVPRTLLRRVSDVFQWLQTDPWVKRLVVSLSSDKAVWVAIMNNEEVRKLIEPLFADKTGMLPSSNENEESDLSVRIWRWIWEITEVKVGELIQKFLSLVSEIFQPHDTEKGNHAADADDKDQIEDRVRSSLLLSVVVLMVVIAARLQRAFIF